MSLHSGTVFDGHGNEFGRGNVQVQQRGGRLGSGIVSDGRGNEFGTGDVQVEQRGGRLGAGIVSDGHGNEFGVGGVEVEQRGDRLGSASDSTSTREPPKPSSEMAREVGAYGQGKPSDPKQEHAFHGQVPHSASGHGRHRGLSTHHSIHLNAADQAELKQLHIDALMTHGEAHVNAVEAEQRLLNKNGAHLKVDGKEGARTQEGLTQAQHQQHQHRRPSGGMTMG